MNRKEYDRQYYLANREAIIERNKATIIANRQADPHKARERDRNYYARHREKILEKRKKKKDNPKTEWVFIVKHGEKVSFD